MCYVVQHMIKKISMNSIALPDNGRQIAIIDLGSVRAKVSIFNRNDLAIFYQKSYDTFLGKDLKEDKIISEEALVNLEEAFLDIQKIIQNQRIFIVKCIATDAIRQAKNQDDVHYRFKKYFPDLVIEIIDQIKEGDLFFGAVARNFEKNKIAVMDVGGGSVQFLYGEYKDGRAVIEHRFLLKTGTMRLQEKYSPDVNSISGLFGSAREDIADLFDILNIKSDILVFGSTQMQNFMRASGIEINEDKSFRYHPFWVSQPSLNNLLEEVIQFPASQRTHFYPEGGQFSYGADYLLLNVISAAKKIGATHIYPTNLNSSYGLL